MIVAKKKRVSIINTSTLKNNLGSTLPYFGTLENGERGDKEAATSSSVAVGVHFPAVELRGGPNALQTAPAESRG
jgi:hypothetical protein